MAATHRGHRSGEQMSGGPWHESARRGCALVQLTTDKSRADAHRFYERLGFAASHEGFKMSVDRGPRTASRRQMSGSGTKDDPGR